jgi:hypothetical protein
MECGERVQLGSGPLGLALRTAHLAGWIGPLFRAGPLVETDGRAPSCRLVCFPPSRPAGDAGGTALAGMAGRVAIFRQLASHHWRAQTRLPNESSLVSVVRGLDSAQPAPARAGAATAHSSLELLRLAPPDLSPYPLGDALGLFLRARFLFTLPLQIAVVRQDWLAWSAVAIVLLPLLQVWDGQLWPDEQTAARRAQDRIEAAQWRDAASRLAGLLRAPVLAPWWLSPATAY